MKNRIPLLAAPWLLTLATLSPLGAQTPAAPQTPAAMPPGLVTTGDQITYQVPFSQFMTENEQVVLRNTAGSYSITIPVSDRMEIQSAMLHLEYTSSINLLDERSQLVVLLNDQAIAQIPLHHGAPEGVVDIKMPSALLHHGFNRLSLDVAQHYTMKCEDPTAPELWTQVNTERSTFSFQAKLTPMAGKLSQLDRVFDRKSWGSQKLNVVVSDSEMDQALKWGAAAAEGVALRLQYIPLQVSRSTTIVPNADNVVIGTSGQVATLLGTAPRDDISGSYIGLMPLPSDPAHFALILSGQTAAEVDRAVAAFSVINFRFPDSPSMIVQDMKFPGYLAYQGQMVANEDASYRFSELGFKTATIQGWTHGDAPNYFEFNLTLPPDIYAPEMSQIEFRLHFAHGAAMREDSVLNLMVNGTFKDAIHLNDPNGAEYEDYKIEVPARDFQAGTNLVRFVPAMVPLKSDFCEIIQEQNLLLTLFDDSVVKLPMISHYAELPNLDLFSRTAFPIATAPAGADLSVQVTAQDSATVSAAWTLMAKLAQKIGTPLHDVDLSFRPGSTSHNLVIVGSSGQIPTEIMQAAPFNLGATNKVGYAQALLHPMGKNGEAEGSMQANVSGTGDLGTLGIAMQFQSPYDSSKTVFLLSALNPDLLQKRTAQLVAPALWSTLQGDVCVWDEGDVAVSAQKIGPTYHVGKISFNTRIDYYVSRHPLAFIAGVLALVVILAFVLRLLLDNYKVRHHGKEGTSDSR